MRKKSSAIIMALAGCLPLGGCSQSDRSVALFTDTTIGLEITFDTKAANPLKAILGYNRSEGLLNPVYGESITMTYGEDGTSVKEKTVDPEFRPEAYSVIVRLNSEKDAQGTVADAGAQKGGAQLFITGKAAQLVAQNPATVAALMNGEDGVIETVKTAAR